MLGISLDDVAAQKAFHEAQELNFPLLSDPDGSVAQKYGVLLEKGYSKRVTFVIDEVGNVIHVDTAVDVSSHGSDLVGKVREIQG